MRTLLGEILAVCVLTGFLASLVLSAQPPVPTVVEVARDRAIAVLETARKGAERKGDTDSVYVLTVLMERLRQPVSVKGVAEKKAFKFVGMEQVDTGIVVLPGQSVSVRFRPELPPGGEVACHVRTADPTGTKWLKTGYERWKAEAEPHEVERGGRLFLIPGGMGTSTGSGRVMEKAGSFEATVTIFAVASTVK